jgi:hypothetical protein
MLMLMLDMGMKPVKLKEESERGKGSYITVVRFDTATPRATRDREGPRDEWKPTVMPIIAEGER